MATTPRSNITRLSYLVTLLLAMLQFPPLLHASDQDYSLFERGNGYVYRSFSNSTDGLSQTYGQNLEQLFRSLVNSTGFSNISVGKSTPYAAYGLSLCRDDLTADRCRNCIGNATESAKVECPNNRSAMIWIGTGCLLHFSDTRFFGTFNQKNWQAWEYKVSTRASDNVAQEFLYGLVKQTGADPKMFGTKIGGNTYYGMAQCTRDLTIDTCKECLSTAMNEITKWKYTLALPWLFISSSSHIRYNTIPFFAISTAPAPAPSSASASQPPATVESPPAGSRSGNQRKTVIIIGSTVGILLLALGFSVLLFRSRNKKELNEELRRYNNEIGSLGNLNEDERNHELPHYSLKAVQAATNNFSQENRLGRGGFGPVHKGEVSDRIVAVKRLFERSGQGLKDFMNEVILIAKLQHKNLVCLLGCCVERGEKMLIYEFMPVWRFHIGFCTVSSYVDAYRQQQYGGEGRLQILTSKRRGWTAKRCNMLRRPRSLSLPCRLYLSSTSPMGTTPRPIIPRLSYLLILLLSVLQSPLSVHASNQDVLDILRENRYIGKVCFTAAEGLSPTYEKNLEQLFRSLADSVSSNGFYNTSVGQKPYTAYGLAQCRGDVPADICRSCTAAAIKNVTIDCSNNTAGMMWLESCFIRFSNTRFFGILDVGKGDIWIVPDSITSEKFDARVLLYGLVDDAVKDQKMFHTRTQPQNGYTSYGLAQCRRDLTRADCKNCFDRATEQVESNHSLGQEWRFTSPSCIIVYYTWPFFLTSPAPEPAPANIGSSPSAIAPSPTLESPPVGGKSGNQRRTVIVICSTAGFLLLAVGFSVLLFCSRKRKVLNGELRRYSNEMGSLGNLNEDESNHELPHYSLKAVQAATNNFSEENKLGRGGFGPVYKGELSGRIVAVKRLSERSGQGLKEFMNEVILIAKLQHKNLVRLLGCCVERGEKMLIYEFMPNGSLDAFFYDPEKRKALDWEKRFNIIMGSARGIIYLHQDSRLNIIHRDLKAGNILLDEQMTAKISDFGMARIFSGDNDPKATNIIVGTHGYMAPEYAIDGQFSTKSDVYSFGVLLLEIVSGQTYSGFHLSQMGCSLIGCAWSLWRTGRLSDLIDPVLGESAPTSRILKCSHIGLLCVQEDPASRPTMSAIINMLESDSPTLPTPRQPPLVFSDSSSSMTSANDSSKSGNANSRSLSRLKNSR